MKKILTATDFSVPADNAVNYAAELANEMKASLTILNSFHIPISTTEPTIPMITIDELEKNSLDVMKTLKLRIAAKFPKLDVNIRSTAGFAVDEISEYASTHKSDLIVVGITGAGKFSERLFGSTSTSLVKNTSCPVMIVPKECTFRKPTTIGFACDLKGDIHPSELELLKELTAHFNATLEVFNVLKPEEVGNFEKATHGVQLENILNDTPHNLHFPESEDIEAGIEHFIEEHKIDLLALVKRKHSFFENFLHESNTKKLAFHSHIPLLVIHE